MGQASPARVHPELSRVRDPAIRYHVLHETYIGNLVMLCRNCRSRAVSSAEISLNSIPTPNPGRLLTTFPLTISFSSLTHRTILSFVPYFTGIGISTKHPPRLRSDAFPQSFALSPSG